ncbi:MAG: hypothetical protein APF82_08305 [Sphingomonadales bacterium BRH_c42]|nr:MAG: hypothetical protein APF82_08305 [Sphingomonadales bacterium BRH_c42]
MLSLILEYRDEAQQLFALVVCVSSLLWGGGPERALALVWLAMFEFAQLGYLWAFGEGFASPTLPLAYMAIDTVAAGLFTWIALQANRTYTLWIAAFQLVALLAHLSRELAPAISPLAYSILAIAPSYFQLALMAGGLWAHVRRRRKFGPYRDWRRSAWAQTRLARALADKQAPGNSPL